MPRAKTPSAPPPPPAPKGAAAKKGAAAPPPPPPAAGGKKRGRDDPPPPPPAPAAKGGKGKKGAPPPPPGAPAHKAGAKKEAGAPPPPPPAAKKARTAGASAKVAGNGATGTAGSYVADGKLPRARTPRQAALPEGARSLRVLAWNVGGLRAALKNDRASILQKLVKDERPHVVCLQEHKLQKEHLTEVEQQLRSLVPSYSCHWAVSTSKAGYSGVVCLVSDAVTGDGAKASKLTAAAQSNTAAPTTKQKTLAGMFAGAGGLAKHGGALAPTATLVRITEGVGQPARDAEYNKEGRVLTLEFDNPKLALVLAYVPNSGQNLARLEYRIGTYEEHVGSYLDSLKAKGLAVCYMGDLNVAHQDRDIWNHDAKHIPKSAGTTPQERETFGALLQRGYVDTFRKLHPDADHVYTYWSVRAGNKPLNRGLRLDYALLSDERLLHDAAILDDADERGDHAPIFVELRL